MTESGTKASETRSPADRYLADRDAPLALRRGTMGSIEMPVSGGASVQIVVTELPIEDAVGRATERFRQADQRLSQALAGSAAGLPWMALGMLGSVAGSLALTGVLPLSADAARAIGILLLVLGGALLGYGLPLWMRAREETTRRMREWQHALALLRLREQQAEENPALTVEVLERVDRHHPLLKSGWNDRMSATAKYVQ